MFLDNQEVDSYASTITKSTYHPVSISTIVDTQKYLSVEDREILSTMLNKHTFLFDGILKVYSHQLVHLDIIPNETPHHYVPILWLTFTLMCSKLSYNICVISVF